MKRALIIGSLITLSFLLIWTRGYRENPEQPLPELIVVGTAADFPPFEFHQQGDIVGFDIDLAKALIARLGKRMVLRELPFEALIPQLNEGAIHLVIAALSRTPEREAIINMSTPYLGSNPLMVLSRKSKPYDRLDELAGKTILVVSGQTAGDHLGKQSPDATLRQIITLEGAMKLFESGTGDALVAEAYAIAPYLQAILERGDRLIALPDTDERASVGVAQRNSLWLRDINFALESLQKDGTIDQLREKWNIT